MKNPAHVLVVGLVVLVWLLLFSLGALALLGLGVVLWKAMLAAGAAAALALWAAWSKLAQ